MRGYLFALAATLIWSGNFIVARGFTEHVPPVTLAFLRWSVALAVLAPIAAPAIWRNRRLIVRRLPYLAACGFLGVTLFNTLVYIAGHTTEALNMSLIATTTPIFIIILSRVFLGDPITLRRTVGLMAAVVGIALLITDGELSRLLDLRFTVGDLWMLVAALGFAVYSLLVQRMPPEMNQRVYLSSAFTIGILLLLPWLAWERAAETTVNFTPSLVGSILYLGIGASLVSFYCWNRAIMAIGPAKSALIYYSLPVFAGIEGVIFLGETPGPAGLVSGIAIIGGIVLATTERTTERERKPNGSSGA